MVKPISPDQVGNGSHIPDEVFEVVNKLLQANWTGSSATIKQKDVISALGAHYDSQAIFDNGWLNFEGAYKAQGWKVVYDKPGYNESYGAYWKFTRK